MLPTPVDDLGACDGDDDGDDDDDGDGGDERLLVDEVKVEASNSGVRHTTHSPRV